MPNYQIKDLGLASQGFKNIELACSQMLSLMAVAENFQKSKPFKGLRVGMALHITKETAVLVRTLRAGGAEVFICSCNPLSTQDDVAAALAQDGVSVFGYKGESKKDYYKFLENVIACKPNITIDDGCDLVCEIHKNYPELIKKIIGGCEETTTGVLRLKAMEKDNSLKYPIVAVNDNLTKHLMDNYYGTGQSTIDGIMRACNFLFAGKTVVISGYGDCGKGIALRAKGLGAKVIVAEVDYFRALQAFMDGYLVMPIAQAAALGDLFVTVTGDIKVITLENMKKMKDGAILCNSGHFDCEIDLDGLKKFNKNTSKVRPFMEEYNLKNGKRIFVLGEGRLVNLVAGEGHPSEVMSLSFCGQALACEYLVKNKGRLKNKVYKLPEAIDQGIAKLQLECLGVKIDKLTAEQKKYLGSWEVGT